MSDENKNLRLEVNQSQLAEIFDCVPRYIRTLEEEAVIERISGRSEVLYDAVECARRYITHLRNRKPAGNQETADYNAARAAKAAAEAERVQIVVAKMKGEAISLKRAELVYGLHITASKQKFLALPHKLGPMLLGQTKVADVVELIEKHIHEALNELADYRPEQLIDPKEVAVLKEAFAELDKDPVERALGDVGDTPFDSELDGDED